MGDEGRRRQEVKGLRRWTGEGPAEGGEHVAVGGGDGPVIVVAEVAGPSSYTDREVAGLTPDQALAAVRHGSLSAPQMSRLLDVCRRFVAVAGEAEASSEEAQAVAAIQAAAASQAVEEAKAAAAEAKAAAAEATAAAVAQAAAVANAAAAALAAAVTQAPGSVGAIERMLQDALQGPGHSDAGLVAGLTAGLPTDQQIQVVLPFLQDPDEGLSPARVATALYQGFGRPAAATVAALLAAPAMAPWGPDAGLSAPGAASGDRLGAGLGASASGDDVSQVDFEDTARLAYQRLKQDLGPPIHTQFLATELPAESEAALRLLREIGKRQHWDSLLMGDAPALGVAVLAAWSSGQHGSLSSGDREELTAVKDISEFQGGRLAEILESTPAGQRGYAVWAHSQDQCGSFIVTSADRSASEDSTLLARAAELEAAFQEGAASPLGARVGRIVAVLAASSRRPLSKKDGQLAEEQLKAQCTDWASVRDPSAAVRDADAVVRRAHRCMSQASWHINTSVLDEVQRILEGDAAGRRSPAWEKWGKLLAEWARTQKHFKSSEGTILLGLVEEAERLAPKTSLPLSSDLSTLKTASVPADPARSRDAEAGLALAKREAMAKREAEARSAKAKAAASGSKPAKTLAHVAAVGRPGLAPVPGRDGVTAPGPAACRFCAAPGHRVDQCPTVEYVPGRSGTIDAKWCKCFACSSFGHKQQDCPSLAQKNGVPPSATAAVGGASV